MKNLFRAMTITLLIMIMFMTAACSSPTGSDGGGGAIPVAPAITTASLPDGEAGEPYYETLTATGTAPITWSLDTSSKLPEGLSLNAGTGVISGTPTTVTAYSVTFIVIAKNSAGSDSKMLSIKINPGPINYSITYDSFFTATREGGMHIHSSGGFQDVIDAIKEDAAGELCRIQFGSGTEVLDIGYDLFTFNGGAGGADWGPIRLTGKITSECSTAPGNATIYLTNGVSVNSRADIANTGSGGAVNNDSTGTFEIISGTVTAKAGFVIQNTSSGIINISGGTVSNTSGLNTSNAIRNESGGTLIISGGTVSEISGIAVLNTGTVIISGGTVSADSGIAVQNGGKLNVSGTAMVTSANTATDRGTIYDYSSDTEELFVISGGTVRNTSSGNAVYHDTLTGSALISGGTVSSAIGSAVYNRNQGKLTVSGDALVTSANPASDSGTIYLEDFSPGTADRLVISGGTVNNTASDITGSTVYNNSTGAVNISGGIVSAINCITLKNISVGDINISDGTVSSGINNTVHNATSGTVNISGGIVSASSGNTVVNSGTGAVHISGGTVSATASTAIYNASTGEVIISGGTVSATTGVAVLSYSTGKITISQDTGKTTLVTSANITPTEGTINISYRGISESSVIRLEITGGTVSNTAGNTNSRAINNYSSEGIIIISGGTVSAIDGYAIWNNSSGTVTITPPAVIIGEKYPPEL